MGVQSGMARIAVMTFAYEGDKSIGFELLESLVSSFKNTKFDLYFTDDASSSRLDRSVVKWAESKGISAYGVRYDHNLGFRGAVERTLRLLKLIAQQPRDYDVILRIDTDALVIKEGLDLELLQLCTDPKGLYGVLKNMRPKDRLGYLLDLLPFGFKRVANNDQIGSKFSMSRKSPVWWWREGFKALTKGFRFKYVEGSCYIMGGAFPKELMRLGILDRFDRNRHGLITSEEDVVVTTLCRSAGLPLYQTNEFDPRWKLVNILGKRVLDMPVDELPFVIHALKADPAGSALRKKVRAKMPLFDRSRSLPSGEAISQP
ncbi:hypothetical protein [Microbulbifer hydrolyticus]|uniref:Glycosyltransferase n=1 Tax=Microbulbifer hydrolyticus TaxID=48074 RepID=A0A6P1TEY7_9GAMM|nr:hypothetical protein [Microbulbifer hydrolyticus]MBB5211845.1 hypothetical protein [Microbulbifer hydrolyticus]QHQ40567.1 hypothetical protein GTQ55_17335 [Microbulbifer hydrolyticus]